MISVPAGRSIRFVTTIVAVLVITLLIALFAHLTAAPVRAAAPLDPVAAGSAPAVLVSGTGTVDLVPDIARLMVSIQTTASTASQAESENAATTEGVRRRVLATGIAVSDVKTVGVQVWPQYDYRSSPYVLTGFTATQTLQITIHDLRRIGAVIDAAVAGGATSVQGITYDLSNHTAATEQALALAVSDAQGKAKAMASAAGVRLGSVVSMTAVEPTPYPFPIMRAATSAGGAGTQVSPPDVQLTVSVTIGWSIG